MDQQPQPLRIHLVNDNLSAFERAKLEHQKNARAYEEEMQKLSKAGSDPSGAGPWRGIMKRVGRL